MTRYIGPTTDNLLRRVRAEGSVGTSEDFAMSILSYAQQLSNVALKKAVTSGSITTYAYQLVYGYRNTFSDAVDILTIKSGTRTLQRMDSLADLTAYDPDWFRATSTRHEFWCQLGKELLVIYPALTSNSSLTVIYSKITAYYKDYLYNYNESMELSDEDIDIPVGLAELVLLLRSRRVQTAVNRVKELTSYTQKLLGVSNA